MKSDLEKDALVRMFKAYCRRSLLNARTDIIRASARRAKREKLFCDMRESELNRIAAPYSDICCEVVFDVGGRRIGVTDETLAAAIAALGAEAQAVILLHYFAGWPDGRIAGELAIPRSTVQYRRSRALQQLKGTLTGRGESYD